MPAGVGDNLRPPNAGHGLAGRVCFLSDCAGWRSAMSPDPENPSTAVPAPAPAATAPTGLDRISTQWPLLQDPAHFVVRYGPAVRKYLLALVRHPHDADEIAQEFLLKGITQGFARATPDRGRFRDYLKVSVRNAALNFLTRTKKLQQGDLNLQQIADPATEDARADQEYLAEWRRVILDRCWRALDSHQRQSPGNLFHTVLKVAADLPEASSEEQAATVTRRLGRPIRADAFRKQLSRARRFFAGLVVEEVAQTLEGPTRERVEEELIDSGLMPYIRDYLPKEGQSEADSDDA